MKIVAPFAAFLALVGLALADVRFTEKSVDARSQVLKEGETKEPTSTRVAIKGPKIKFTFTDDVDVKKITRESIYDGTEGRQQDLDPVSKSYGEMDKEFLDGRAEMAKNRVADLEKRMSMFQGDRKARVEKFLFWTKKVLGLHATAPKVELTRTGEKQKLGDFDCERIVIKEANEKGEMEVVFDCWMTEAVEGWSTYAAMFASQRAFSPGVLEKMKEIKGFHVKGVYTVFWLEDPGWIQVSEFDNSDLKIEAVEDKEFVVPTDYKNNTSK